MVKAKILKLSSRGILKVKFNTTMVPVHNMTWIDENVLRIEVIPEPSNIDRLNVSKLNLAWEALSFDNTTLTIRIMFDYPSYVSQFELPDILKVHFKSENASLFSSAASREPLSLKYRTLLTAISA